MTNSVKHGIELLQDPSLNKSTAFTETEKQELKKTVTGQLFPQKR